MTEGWRSSSVILANILVDSDSYKNVSIIIAERSVVSVQ